MPNTRLNLHLSPQFDENCDSQQHQAESIAYEMAYGLSHELNNPLANIAGRARLLAEQETDPEKRQQLAIIVDQAMRGCEMIADLMLFAKPPAWVPISVDLRSMIVELCDRVRQRHSASRLDVVLEIDTDHGAITVHADRQALVEAIWAVLRNSGEVARSRVCVWLGSHEPSSREPCCKLEITDDGPGLSEKALDLAFHPYFSGREAGRGLGLGLSKARRIIKLCGGDISLQNIAPNGCQATITLPVQP